ncbi:MAG: fluoride efflux transporter FluC [Nocardioidaceae bacterium]
MPPDTLPEVTLRARPRRPRYLRRLLRRRGDILAVIAVGGALGSLGRYGLDVAFPHGPRSLPWGTAIANVSGAVALGMLMVLVVDIWPTTRLVRPFLGVGVIGGYTTFSTAMLETRSMLAGGAPALAAAYLFGSVLVGLAGVAIGIFTSRWAVSLMRARRHRRTRRSS